MRRASSHASAAFGLVVGMLISGTAVATVTDATDPDPAIPGTLRYEIDNASAGDVIDIQLGVADGLETVGLRTTLVFTQNLTIDNSSTDTALVDVVAPAGSAFLEIQNGVSVAFRDVGLAGVATNTGDDIDLQGATSLLTIDTERADQLLTVDIVGLGALRKEGSAVLQLAGINTFTGGITVEDGDLVGEVRSLGSGDIVLAPDESTETARLVFDFAGTDTLGASGPSILDMSSGGGTAGIVKRGAGTLVVSAATIDGSLDFDIEAGSLRVGATQMTNGHDFDVALDATLEIDAVAGSTSFAGIVTGAGMIDVEADALTFTSDPSGFTGTFDVNDGPGGSGSLVLDIQAAPAAALTFDAVADGANTDFTLRDSVGVTWAGDLSGDGLFIKAGTGTTTLTGLHSQVLGTRVLAGTLVGNTTNLPGNIALAGGSAVVFDQASDATFGGTISDFTVGVHTVTKRGAGTLTLTASHPFSGSFEAERGGLHFAHGADLTGASLRVGNRSMGVVTNLTADFDATGALDNTINVGGPLTFEPDSRVTIGVEPTSGRSNQFVAAGPVTIETGAVLAIETADGIYSATDSWDVITGTSLSGAFAIEQSLFFFDINDSIVALNTLRLSLAPSGATLEAAATTPNGRVIGDQLDDFLMASFPSPSRGEDYQQAITSVVAAEVSALLESVSPDDLAASTQIQLANANRTWRGISDRMALRRIGGVGRANSASKSRRTRPSVSASGAERAGGDTTASNRNEPDWSAWIEAGGVIGELSSSDAKEFEYTSVGPIVGADRAFGENVRAGFALSGGSHRYETNEGNNEGEGGGVEGTVYGAWLGDPVEVIAGGRYAWARIDTERTIEVGTIADGVDGELEGHVFGAFLEVTRGFALPGRLEIAPLASVAYTGLRWDGFDESGTSPLAVQVDDQEIDSILTSVGLRLAGERNMQDDLWLRPRLRILWNHEWGDVERTVSGQFASAPTASLSPFEVEGAEVPEDHAEIGFGWETGFTDNASLFFDWEGRFGEDLIENAVSAGGRVVW